MPKNQGNVKHFFEKDKIFGVKIFFTLSHHEDTALYKRRATTSGDKIDVLPCFARQRYSTVAQTAY